jgi:tRNA-specific 2-thiouridylase
VPGNDYGNFLRREYFNPQPNPGKILTRDGKIMGEHPGYYHFTKGQRRGLGVAFKERLYVIETRPETNEVIVGSKKDVRDQKMKVGAIHWFLKPGEKKFSAKVKIRSQHKPAKAQVERLSEDTARVIFEKPEEAVTAGQAAVFYDGAKVLGGGWIEAVGEAHA